MNPFSRVRRDSLDRLPKTGDPGAHGEERRRVSRRAGAAVAKPLPPGGRGLMG
jgi:hypothetical protein